jgi:hypothetical protein
MSTQAPTYKQFRDFALSHGYTGRTLAPHVEADEPIKTATRILVFLAGTRWDDEPLPYPKLCQFYFGEVASTTASRTCPVLWFRNRSNACDVRFCGSSMSAFNYSLTGGSSFLDKHVSRATRA